MPSCEGFFPLQDTGVIPGISEAPQSVSFAAMAERQRALPRRSGRPRRGKRFPFYRRGWNQHDAHTAGSLSPEA